jgi:PPOX class probable F420-dependent enzyme
MHTRVDPPTSIALSGPVRRFLEDPRFGSLATLDPDGAPHQAIVWYRLEPDGRIMVNSAVGRRWPANLERDPRVSLSIEDAYAWIGLVGEVDEIERDWDRSHADINALARRYHADEPQEAERLINGRFASQERISFRIRITRVHDHLED